MRKYYNYSLLFLLLAATIGLFLRWQFINPTPGVRFAWFVHSHSHVMFLGWVLNVLYLAFIEHYFPVKDRPASLKLFGVFVILILAMMISFPLQGYGTYSIIFSTLHTLAVMVFIVIFFRRSRGEKKVSLWFAKIAWLFFFVSTAGPFSLGYLMANGMGQTVWYQFSIYFYLHFQYNGFFLFGIFSLFYLLLEQKHVRFDEGLARRFGALTAIACVPAYALSILFANPGLAFNIIGAGAATLQLFALLLFFRQLRSIAHSIRSEFSRGTRSLFGIIVCALLLKSLLQLFSAHPSIARLAYELRPVVIAYLHLVLVGIITLFLLCWYMERKFVSLSVARLSLIVLLAGFLGSEIALVIMPWWSYIVGDSIRSVDVIFGFSLLMWLGITLFYLAFLIKSRNMVPGGHELHLR